ncbi:type 3 dihydrofolate reductase [Salinimonas chungwhensis]|uniref:type 3 dihydrofolate reductase n=1 Tax=Salinimonas chungwhensis TaxID=265425 RepID=UPI00036C3681|nr:type 3 dihydrofolate reductase [Salinimonas chungwhensis]
MKIAMIAAMAADRVIGMDNTMPWHLPADLRHFKAVTLGKPVVMGRKTYESIGKALPGRTNIVVSGQADFSPSDAHKVNAIDDAVRLASELASEAQEVMIIGGGRIYEAMLEKADKLYLTFIDLTVDGDTQFPEYSHLNWQQTASESHAADDNNPYNYQFVTLERQ